MKAQSTQFAEQIKSVLQGVTVANGYLTDIGLSVHRGFWAHVLDARSTTYPAAVIHPGSETPESLHGSGGKALVRIEVPIVVAVELTVDEASYDVLQACMADVRKALIGARDSMARLGQANSVEVGPAVPDLSPDSRFALAAMTVAMSIVETY